MTALASLLTALTLSSGLHGVVTRGPITPVCRAEEPCSAPAAGIKLSFVRASRTFTTKTDAKGGYRILLAPGTYRIAIVTRISSYAPRLAVVRRDVMARRDIAIDTGIR